MRASCAETDFAIAPLFYSELKLLQVATASGGVNGRMDHMWINAEAQINGVAVWLKQQHHSVTTPQPLDLTPQLRRALTQF